MAIAPPIHLALTVQSWSPRIWPAFYAAAQAGLRPDSFVTSWWRSPGHNASVGGSRDSQHLIGTAFDVITKTGARAAQINQLRRAGFRVVDELNHIHVQAFEAGAVRRVGLLAALGL